MMTKAPACEIMNSSKEEIAMKEKSAISMEIPLQKMFDEMIVFISKTDFE